MKIITAPSLVIILILISFLSFLWIRLLSTAGSSHSIQLAPISTTPNNPPASSPVIMSVSDLVRKLISDNIVMVFSKSWCPYCAKAKRVLSKYPIKSIHVLELDSRDDGDSIQDELAKITGGRSVPRVFIAGKFIGGGDDTERLDREGKLQQLLTEAGAI